MNNSILSSLDDDKIISAYNLAVNKRDFYSRLGYKISGGFVVGKELSDRLKRLGLDISEISNKYRGKVVKNITDELIINSYKLAGNKTEFFTLIGYTTKGHGVPNNIPDELIERFNELGVNLDGLKYKSRNSQPRKTAEELLKTRQDSEQIRKLSRKRFNAVDIKQKCIHCGYDKHIEIAHIIPVSEIKASESEDFNIEQDLNNTIPLCPNCHWEFDHNGLDLSKEIDKYRKYLKDNNIIEKVKQKFK